MTWLLKKNRVRTRPIAIVLAALAYLTPSIPVASLSYIQREGFSKYNRIYEFKYTIENQQCDVMMTSVSGHLTQLEFAGGASICWPLTAARVNTALLLFLIQT